MAKPADIASTPTPNQGAGETVLLVEDDPSIRLLVTEVLQRARLRLSGSRRWDAAWRSCGPMPGLT